METEKLKEILDLHGKWLRGENGGQGADLSGADLRWANLSGANLSGAKLSGANLSGADLRWADLSGADLRGADLSGADLRGANLSGADLSWANLRWADLSGADLSGADLSGADLRWANLSWANLSGAEGILRSECGWTDHGECGHQLLCVYIDGGPRYFCGCFAGSENELIAYIDKGHQSLRASCMMAYEFCRDRIREMVEARQTAGKGVPSE